MGQIPTRFTVGGRTLGLAGSVVHDAAGVASGMGAVEAAVLKAGGTIEIYSAIGQGTQFVIKIPQTETHAKGALAA